MKLENVDLSGFNFLCRVIAWLMVAGFFVSLIAIGIFLYIQPWNS